MTTGAKHGSMWLGVLLAFAVILLPALMNMDRNDFLYGAAAARPGALYSDVHHVQAPLTHWFWRGVFLATPDGVHFLTMRIVSAALVVASLVPVLLLVLKTHRARLIFIGLSAFNLITMQAGMEIGNYSLSLFLISVGIALSFTYGTRAFFLGAVFFGLAAAVKVNAVLLVVPGLLLIAFDHNAGVWRAFRRAAAYGALFVAGSFLNVYYFLSAPREYLLHNVWFHSELTPLLRDIAATDLVLTALGLFAVMLVWHLFEVLILARSRTREGLLRNPLFLFFIVSLAMALMAGLVQRQYLALPSFILTIMIAAKSDAMPMPRWAGRGIWGLITVRLILVSALIFFGLRDNGLLVVDHHRLAGQIRDQIAESGGSSDACSGDAFSLTGTLLLDAGVPLAPYSEAGFFWVRLDPVVSDAVAAPYPNLDMNLIHPFDFVTERNTEFVVTGYFPDTTFEAAFVGQAEALGYTSTPLTEGSDRGVTLYVKSECGGQ